jgi:hypothetical protein
MAGHVNPGTIGETMNQAFAIVRVDKFQESTVAPENKITVKKIVWDENIARSEVDRLNAINKEKNCSYFWQVTRVEDKRAACANPSCAERPFRKGDFVTSCPACGKHYHDACWPGLGQQHDCTASGSNSPSYWEHLGGVILRAR